MLNQVNSVSQSITPALVAPADRGTSPIAWLLDNPSTQPTEEQRAEIAARLGRGLPGRPVVTDIKNRQGEGLSVRFCLMEPSAIHASKEKEFLICKFELNRTKGNIDAVRVVNEEKQAPHGWGKTFARNLFSEAMDAGVPAIGASTRSVGSYLWLKCGFEVSAHSRLSPNTYLVENKLSPEDKKRLGELVRAKDYWGIADFTVGSKKYGYDLTKGPTDPHDHSWEGAIDFTNPKHVARMNGYLGMDKEPMRKDSQPAQSKSTPAHN